MNRTQEHSLVLVVSMTMYVKQFGALIDSKATRCPIISSYFMAIALKGITHTVCWN